ncbi:acyl-ACP--UDP-N-acetylglucosamine O-acyltransferase [Rhodovarius crocodyli]|uniref:Acyl-[acyl-carrier-protein]--UDP-N-acetylglucosamine O-acyltransferase n=1 Tax=Rhodovarius crocodyli TaxID=1979269 RepID=A0A437MJK9_9PROT|nr:acyl-ACP--UDP-N-acetylglucosamine O-acyltransferase [Rhodovarius crocodyli]RVT97832.1 acyl-ACP--UDP-N-acetylglucosamine O-acyltransferase [Rhodovarius crocodyli]
MNHIHPSAVIADGARIGAGVTIGPFCTVGPDVVLHDGVELASHNAVEGHTVLHEGVRLAPFASVGLPPQDLKYKGEPTRCEIGARSYLREHVTVHRGSVGGEGITRVGADCLFMACSHVGHDCQVADRVIMANNVLLGGHVRVGEQVFIGGAAAVHQLVRIGRHAMIGGLAGVTNDIPPFGNAFGLPARLVGLNFIGLRRRGFTKDDLAQIRLAFRLLFKDPGVFAEKLVVARERFAGNALVEEVLGFIGGGDRRRELIRPGRMAVEEEDDA